MSRFGQEKIVFCDFLSDVRCLFDILAQFPSFRKHFKPTMQRHCSGHFRCRNGNRCGWTWHGSVDDRNNGHLGSLLASTCTKMMAGVVSPTKRDVIIDGKKVNFRTPIESLNNGIAMVFQETSLIPSLTVAQNLYFGTENRFNLLRGLYISVQQFLQSLSFGVAPTMLVCQLGAAQKQMVEIARAIHRKAKVIIFDEPTATLTPEEKRHFFALARRLKSQGVSIIFISHALEEALLISDRITILRDGKHVVTDFTSTFVRNRIIREMVGRKLSDKIYANHDVDTAHKAGARMLSVQNLSMGKMVRNSSFAVFSGKITDIFGLIGSSRTEIAKIIAGVVKRDLFHGGELYLEAKPVRYRVPHSAVRVGIVYVSEDCKLECFFAENSIAENIFSGVLGSSKEKSVIVMRSDMLDVAKRWSKVLNVKAIDSGARVVELSGGNQQKVVVAKALSQKNAHLREAILVRVFLLAIYPECLPCIVVEYCQLKNCLQIVCRWRTSIW